MRLTVEAFHDQDRVRLLRKLDGLLATRQLPQDIVEPDLLPLTQCGLQIVLQVQAVEKLEEHVPHILIPQRPSLQCLDQRVRFQKLALVVDGFRCTLSGSWIALVVLLSPQTVGEELQDWNKEVMAPQGQEIDGFL